MRAVLLEHHGAPSISIVRRGGIPHNVLDITSCMQDLMISKEVLIQQSCVASIKRTNGPALAKHLCRTDMR